MSGRPLAEARRGAEAVIDDLRGAVPERLVLAMRRGVLPALVSVGCFGVGILLAFGEWAVGVQRQAELTAYLAEVLDAQHEGRREDPQLGRAALLLAAANRRGERDLALGPAPGRGGDVLRALQAGFTGRPAGSPTLEPCGGAADITASPSDLQHVPRRPYTLDDLALYPDETGLMPVLVARQANDPIYALDGFSYGPAACLAGRNPVVAMLPPAQAGDDALAGRGPLDCRHVTHPLEVSVCALADAAALVRDVPAAPSDDASGDAPIVAIYFVGATGGLAFRTLSSKPAEATWQQPWRRYDAASYVEFFLKRPRFVNEGRVRVSPWYFDWFGNGIVRTACTPVYASGDDVRAALRWTGTDFQGVFCVDEAADEAQLAEIVGDNPVFSISEWCVTPTRIERPSHRGDGTCASGLAAAELSGREQELLHQATRLPFARGVTSLRSLGGPEPRSAATAIAARRYVDDSVSVLLLHPKELHARAPVLLLAGGFLALALLALVDARRRAELLERDAATLEIVRGLPVGVVQLDAEGRVELANERAEEILGTPLRSFGDDAAAQHRVGDLLDPHVVRLRSRAQARAREPAEPLVALDYAADRARRELLAPSHLVGRVPPRGDQDERYVLIYGLPLIDDGKFHSFGVIEAIDQEEEKRIQQAMWELQRRTQRVPS